MKRIEALSHRAHSVHRDYWVATGHFPEVFAPGGEVALLSLPRKIGFDWVCFFNP
jgi:hypothetical protein